MACGGFLGVAAAAAVLSVVSGHAAMIIPTSRNALDRVLPEFAHGMSISTTCECVGGWPVDFFFTLLTWLDAWRRGKAGRQMRRCTYLKAACVYAWAMSDVRGVTRAGHSV